MLPLIVVCDYPHCAFTCALTSRPAISPYFLFRRCFQQVSWVRRHEQELHLLTVGMQTYSTDSRFSLHFQHPNDWRLQIKYARPRDEGIYECQISIHPPRIYTVRLIVVGECSSAKILTFPSSANCPLIKGHSELADARRNLTRSESMSSNQQLMQCFNEQMAPVAWTTAFFLAC